MDLFDKAREALSDVEELAARLPGIKGYKEKELRREADKRVREMLAKQLEDQKARLEGIQEELVSAGVLGLLDDLERVGKKLQLLIDRIRTASYGYAPLFDAIRVKEAQLAALADFDKGLFQGVDRIKTIIDKLGTLAGRGEHEWKETIRALGSTIDNLNTAFSHRDEVILQATEIGADEQGEEAEQ